MTPHWHDSNPWAERVIYIPVELAAEIATQPTQWMLSDAAAVLRHWRHYGQALDAYLLPGPSGISLGVRYGADGPDYLSPMANQAKARLVLRGWALGWVASEALGNTSPGAAKALCDGIDGALGSRETGEESKARGMHWARVAGLGGLPEA